MNQVRQRYELHHDPHTPAEHTNDTPTSTPIPTTPITPWSPKVLDHHNQSIQCNRYM